MIDLPCVLLVLGMTSLKELDLSRCVKVNDAGIKHILSIENLERLHIAETGVTAEGVKLLSSLRNLSVLDLGGLPVNDTSIIALQVSISVFASSDTENEALLYTLLASVF